MGTAEILSLTRQYQADLDAKDSQVTQDLARRWLLVEQDLQQDILDLATELSEMAGQGQVIKQWRLNKLRRYTRLLAQLQEQLQAFNAQAAVDISWLQNQAAFAGIQNHLNYINEVAAFYDAQSVVIQMDRLGSEAVQNIVAIARGGGPLDRLLQNAYPATANAITNKLIFNTALGRNPRQTAREMVRDGLATGLNHALLVARDQQIRAYREAGRQAYERSGVVEAYRRLCAKNTRTCLACLAMDGTIWPTSELMALHPQDRCSQIPIINGLPPVRFQTGRDWFMNQPEKTQRRMMGPGTFEAWQAGRFDFRQLATVKEHPIWGPSARVTSLKDLLAGKGGITQKPAAVKKPELSREDFTPEYWEAKDELGRVENILSRYDRSQLSEGDIKTLKNARDRVTAEREISAKAREQGHTPGRMSTADWSQLADKLVEEAAEQLRFAAKKDREATGEKIRGQANIWAQVGGEARLVRSGGRKREAETLVKRLNRETQAAADDYMLGRLVEYGYQQAEVERLSYTQKRRLIAEIGAGEPQKNNIGQVSRETRRGIVENATPVQRQAAYSIALNPRAGQGLDTWTYGLQAAEKAGRWDLSMPPDYVLEQDQAPAYVRPAQFVQAEDDSFDF